MNWKDSVKLGIERMIDDNERGRMEIQEEVLMEESMPLTLVYFGVVENGIFKSNKVLHKEGDLN